MLIAPSSQSGSPTVAQGETHITRNHHSGHNQEISLATYKDYQADAANHTNDSSANSTRQRLYAMNIARTSKAFHIVIIGGSFAGIRAAQELESLLLPHIATITVIEKRDQYFYNLGALRAMAKPELIDLMWLPYDNIFRHQQNKIIKGEVSAVYPNSVILKDGRKVNFDSLLVATGSIYPPPCKVDTTSNMKGKAELRMFSEMIHESDSILVIGGGPTGVGLAAEIITEYPSKIVILIHSGPRLMSTETNSKSMSRKTHRKLKSLGVKVYLNERVVVPEKDPLKYRVGGRWLETSKGRMIFSHFQFLCNGIKFDTSFMDSLDPSFRNNMIDVKSKQIRVLPTLQINHPELPWIFAAGDVCNTAGEKQAYRADSQGSHVARCMARMADLWCRGESRWFSVQLKQWHDPAQFMSVAMGPNLGVTETPWIVLGDIPTRIMKSKELFLARRYREFNLDFPGMPKHVSAGYRDMSRISRSSSLVNPPDLYVPTPAECIHIEQDRRQHQKQQQRQQRIRKNGGVATDLTHEVYEVTHAMANVALSAADNLDSHFESDRITLGRSAVQQEQENRKVVAFPYAEYYYSQQNRQQGSPIDSCASDDGCMSGDENDELQDINYPPPMPHPTHAFNTFNRSNANSSGGGDAHSTTGIRDMTPASNVSPTNAQTETSVISNNLSKAASHMQSLMHGPVLPRCERERSVFSSRPSVTSQKGCVDGVNISLLFQRNSDPLYHTLLDSARTNSTATINLEQYN